MLKMSRNSAHSRHSGLPLQLYKLCLHQSAWPRGLKSRLHCASKLVLTELCPLRLGGGGRGASLATEGVGIHTHFSRCS